MRWEKLFSQWSDEFETLLQSDLSGHSAESRHSAECDSLFETFRSLKAVRLPVRVGVVTGHSLTIRIQGVGRDFVSGETLEDSSRAFYLPFDAVEWVSMDSLPDGVSRTPKTPPLRLTEVVMRVIPAPRNVVIETRTHTTRGRLTRAGVDVFEVECRGGQALSSGGIIRVPRNALVALWLDDRPTWG